MPQVHEGFRNIDWARLCCQENPDEFRGDAFVNSSKKTWGIACGLLMALMLFISLHFAICRSVQGVVSSIWFYVICIMWGGGILAPVIHRSAHYYVHQRNDQQRFNIVMLLLIFPGNLGVPFFVGLFFASSDSFATILCCRIQAAMYVFLGEICSLCVLKLLGRVKER